MSTVNTTNSMMLFEALRENSKEAHKSMEKSKKLLAEALESVATSDTKHSGKGDVVASTKESKGSGTEDFAQLVMNALSYMLTSLNSKTSADAKTASLISDLDAAVMKQEKQVLEIDQQKVKDKDTGAVQQYQTDSTVYQNYDQQVQTALQTTQSSLTSDNQNESNSESYASSIVSLQQYLSQLISKGIG